MTEVFFAAQMRQERSFRGCGLWQIQNLLLTACPGLMWMRRRPVVIGALKMLQVCRCVRRRSQLLHHPRSERNITGLKPPLRIASWFCLPRMAARVSRSIVLSMRLRKQWLETLRIWLIMMRVRLIKFRRSRRLHLSEMTCVRSMFRVNTGKKALIV